MSRHSTRRSMCRIPSRRKLSRPARRPGTGQETLPGVVKGSGLLANESFDSVWDAIEGTPVQAENMRLRSALMIALEEYIAREGLTQSQAAKVFGVTQPRVSDLIHGKIGLFGLDSLVNMAAGAGLHIEMRVAQAV
jgi:predicted XRE-type DNA-binding protein